MTKRKAWRLSQSVGTVSNLLTPGLPLRKDGQFDVQAAKIALRHARKHGDDALAAMCEAVIARGTATERERLWIPMALVRLAGSFHGDAQAARASRPRPRQDLLSERLESLVRSNPEDTWAHLLDQLQGDDIVTVWDANRVTYYYKNDSIDTKTISVTTFQNRLAKARQKP